MSTGGHIDGQALRRFDHLRGNVGLWFRGVAVGHIRVNVGLWFRGVVV
jgi:hypothetical protein